VNRGLESRGQARRISLVGVFQLDAIAAVFFMEIKL
jgi:hypothetical protein